METSHLEVSVPTSITFHTLLREVLSYYQRKFLSCWLSEVNLTLCTCRKMMQNKVMTLTMLLEQFSIDNYIHLAEQQIIRDFILQNNSTL